MTQRLTTLITFVGNSAIPETNELGEGGIKLHDTRIGCKKVRTGPHVPYADGEQAWN